MTGSYYQATTDDSQGLFGAFPSSNTDWTGKMADRVGIVADTSATGITFMAPSASQDIRFLAGGYTESMVVSSTGRVGVGTSAPSAKFSVGASTSTDAAYFFYDNANVGNTTDGQSLYIYRRSAAGDDYLRIYNYQGRWGSVIDTTSSLYFTGGGSMYLRPNGNITLEKDTFVGAGWNGAGVNTSFIQYGYLTAPAAQKAVTWQVSDVDDNYVLTREDTSIGNLEVKMPIMAGTIAAGSGNGGQIRFVESTGAGRNYVAFRAPDSITSDVLWSLPATDGTANQVLTTNGAGSLTWTTASGGGGDFMRDGSVSMTGQFKAIAGAANAPGYAFAYDTNTGLFNPAFDTIGFTAAGTERMRLDTTGLAIGTTSATGSLTVQGTIHQTDGTYKMATSVSGAANQVITNLQPVNASHFSTLRLSNNGNASVGSSFEFLSGTNQGSRMLYVNSLQHSAHIFAADTLVSGSQWPIIFRTGSNDWASAPNVLTIAVNGNVGVGTDAPTNKLEVKGGAIAAGSQSTTLGGELRLYDLALGGLNYVGFRAPANAVLNTAWTLPATDGSSNQVLTTNGAGSLSWATASGGASVAGSADGQLQFKSASTLAADTALHWDNGNKRLGIGNAFPTSRMHLEYSAGNLLRLARSTNTAGDDAQIEFGLVNAGAGWKNYAMISGGITNNTTNSENGFFQISTMRTGTLTEAMRISSAGNVGIGTTSPSNPLTVVNSQNGTTSLEVQNMNTGASAKTQMLVNSDAGNITVGINSVANGGGTSFVWNSANSPLVFATNNGEKVRIDSSGKMGIGTSGPSQLLEVYGGQGAPATSGTTQNGLYRLSNSTGNVVLDFGINQSGSPYAWLQATQSNGLNNQHPLVLNKNGGNVGIGTNAPTANLHVTGSYTAAGTVSTPLQRLDFTLAPTANLTGDNNALAMTNVIPSSNTRTIASNRGFIMNVRNDSNVQIKQLEGGYAEAWNKGASATVNTIIGFASGAYNSENTTAGTLTGYYAWVEADQGTTNKMNGAHLATFGGGTAGDVVGVRIESGWWSGSITNRYGILIETPTLGVNATNEYGIYQQSATSKNYFAGRIGIGTSSPAAPIHVKSEGTSATALRVSNSSNGTMFEVYEQASGAGQLNLRNGSATQKVRLDANGDSYFDGGNLSVGTVTSSQRLTVNGNVIADGYLYTSDRRLKTDIKDLDGLETILALRGVKFRWKQTGASEYGLIAQEVEEIAPDLVVTDKNGMKSVKYGNIVAPLIEATKELYDLCKDTNAKVEQHDRDIASLKEENQSLKAKNEELEQRVRRLEKLMEKVLDEKK